MFGPDGKPIMHHTGPIIGGPKGVGDFEPLDEAGVEDFLLSVDQVLEQVLQSGQPLDMPAAALPPKSLAHLAQTIRAFQARITDLEAQVAGQDAEEAGEAGNGRPALDLSKLLSRE